jgi:hypothetical protein
MPDRIAGRRGRANAGVTGGGGRPAQHRRSRDRGITSVRRGAEPVGVTASASESRTEFKALVGPSREAKIEGRSPRPLRQRLLSALPRLQKGWWPVGRLVRRPWR